MSFDAGEISDHVQLPFVAGIFLGSFSVDSLLNVTTLMSRKSKLSVRSIGAGEILAASKAVDKEKILKKAVTELLGVDVKLQFNLNLQDLFYSRYSQRSSIDKSI